MSWQNHLQNQHADRVDANLWRERSTLESPQAAVVTIHGQPYDNFCSNDYLGLANDLRLIEATWRTYRSLKRSWDATISCFRTNSITPR